MLNDEICKLRDELNKSIEQGEDYNNTYRISVELDNLIAQYYRTVQKEEKNEYRYKNDIEVLNFV